MISRFLLILVFYALSACLVKLVLSTQKVKKSLQTRSHPGQRLPPGPRRLPLIGNLHQLGTPLHRSLHVLADQHGDLIFLQLGSVCTLVISSADTVREIFKTHDLVFSGRPELYAAKRISYNCSNISFSPYNENWRNLRKIATMELFSPKIVQRFSAVREEEVAHLIDSIAHSSGPINLTELAFRLSNTYLCRTAFGRKPDSIEGCGTIRVDELLPDLQDLLAAAGIADFFPWMNWINKFNGINTRLEKIFRELDSLYDKIIEEHLNPGRTKPEIEDLVDVLLRLQKDPNQVPLRDDSIRGVLTDTFIAGTDTTAATLIWTMTELIRNPSVMKKAQDEMKRTVQGKTKVEESDLSDLVYLKSVVKEALRLHPPAPLLVPRETTEDCVIKGYKIPAKTRVLINASKIALDPKSWENPEEFRPERFMDSSIDFKGQHFEVLPFGVGRRGCPGMIYALSVIELALANLLYCFEWELPPGMRREEMDMEEASGITMHKKVPLRLVAYAPV